MRKNNGYALSFFIFFFFVSIMSDWNSNDLQEDFGKERLDCLLRSSFN